MLFLISINIAEDFKGVQKDQLGAGSFGSVYKVVHKANPGFHVAMKVVQFNSESAQREAKALTSLDHPHIVQCYNSFESIDDFHKVSRLAVIHVCAGDKRILSRPFTLSWSFVTQQCRI